MILSYGTLNPDLVHLVDRMPSPGDDIRSRSWRLTWGGKAANMAVALAGWEMDVRLTGLVIGEDPLGDALLSVLERPRLDLSSVERDPVERTRHCLVLVDRSGRRSIVCAGYGDARWSTVPASWAGIRAVVADGFGGGHAAEVLSAARSAGIPTVWLDAPIGLADRAELVVWSRHDRSVGEAEAVAAGGTAVALTAGQDPIEAWWGNERFGVTPPVVTPVDDTGAGDVFAAACARGMALRWPPEQVIRWAAAAGAAVTAHGRDGGIPGLATVDRLAATPSPASDDPARASGADRDDDPWREAGEHWSAFRRQLRDRYGDFADESGPSPQEVEQAFRTLGSAARSLFESVGDAMRDPEVRVRLREVATSVVGALGETIEGIGEGLRSDGGSGDPEDR